MNKTDWQIITAIVGVTAVACLTMGCVKAVAEIQGWLPIEVPITCLDGSLRYLNYYETRGPFKEVQITQACGNDLLHNLTLSDGKFVCHADDINNVKCEKY